MSKKSERRRELKRRVARSAGKEFQRLQKLWVPRNAFFCSICHGRLRNTGLPMYECRKCGRTYDLSEPPLPPEVIDDSQVVLPVVQDMGEGTDAPQVCYLPDCGDEVADGSKACINHVSGSYFN